MPEPTPDADIVIDLDEFREPAPSSGPARIWSRIWSRRLPMWAVVLLVLAGLLGGISSMGLWAARQWVRTQSGEVSLFLAVAGLSAAAGEPGRAVIDGTVAVMNGGPLLVEVDGVAREAAVMFLRGSQRVLPHMTSWAAAHATFPCLESVAPASVTVDLSVRTADGRRRIVTVLLPITGSVWSEAIARVCLHQP